MFSGQPSWGVLILGIPLPKQSAASDFFWFKGNRHGRWKQKGGLRVWRYSHGSALGSRGSRGFSGSETITKLSPLVEGNFFHGCPKRNGPFKNLMDCPRTKRAWQMFPSFGFSGWCLTKKAHIFQNEFLKDRAQIQ